jgi:hypothetical protein
MANPASSEDRLDIAIEALATIEATARRNAETLLSIARTARNALDRIKAVRDEDNSPDLDPFPRDTEGLGNPA